MSERAEQLHALADQQLAGLIDLIATLDDGALRLPCPRRQTDGAVLLSLPTRLPSRSESV